MVKYIASIIVISLLLNFFIIGVFGNSAVEAGFWEENKDGVYSVVKGFLLLWIINYFRTNTGLSLEENDDNNVEEEFGINDVEQRMVELVNFEREKASLSPLIVDYRLVEIARLKARDMIDNNYFDHISPKYGTPFAMMQEEEINYLLAGENIAGARTVEKGFEKLMESTEHKENILEEKYDKVGIGVISGGPYGLMIVQEFIDTGKQESNSP